MIDFDKIDFILCEEIGRLFVDASRKGYDSESFVKTFMNSDVARYMDKRNNFYQWAGKKYLLETMEDDYKDSLKQANKETDENMLFWVGYIYRYWHYYTGENSKEIYKIAPYKTMRGAYIAYHTLSCEMAIERLKEAYNSYTK